MERCRGKNFISTLQFPKQNCFHQDSFSGETNILLKGFTATALTPLLGRVGLAIQLDEKYLLEIYLLEITFKLLFHLLFLVILRVYVYEVHINTLPVLSEHSVG